MKKITSIFVVLWWCQLAFANESRLTPSIFDQFYQDDILEVELKADLNQILENRRTNDYQDAQFMFKDIHGNQQIWSLKVRARGRFRRVTCALPPLKLNFSKGELEAAGLATHDDLKLVTHCLDNERGEDLLIREFLAYKLYQSLSDYAYRVQLVKITYIDSNTGDSSTYYGLLLEDTSELAERLGATNCKECYNVKLNQFNHDAMAVHDLFQYMIGNTDWSINMIRNVKLFQMPDSQFVAIPYDFDFSGLVDAPYAIPDGALSIQSVKDRLFLGFNYGEEQWNQVMKHFQLQKEKLYLEIEGSHFLKKRSKKATLKYLDGFYKNLEKKDLDFLTRR